MTLYTWSWLFLFGYILAMVGFGVLGNRRVTGAILFVLIHSEALSGHWPSGTFLESFGRWFDFYATSPYSAATLAGLTAVLVTVVVSRVTESLPAEHLARVHRSDGRFG